MAASSFTPPDLETDLLNRKAIAQNQIAQGAATDPDTVARLMSIQQNWGWMDPGVQYALAKSGFDAHSPQTQAVAQVATKAQVQRQTARRILDQFDGGGPFGGRLNDLAHSVTHRVGGVVSSVEDVASPFQRPKAPLLPGADAVQSAVGSAVSTAAGAAGAAASGVSSIPGLMPAVRQAGVIANAGLQGVEGEIRSDAGFVARAAQGGSLNPYAPENRDAAFGPGVALQTDLGQEIDAAARGKPIDIGAGYLPDRNSKIAQSQAAAARAAAPTIGGHAFTVGRFAASQNPFAWAGIMEPGDTGYNLLSGLVDAGVAFKADPTALVMKGGAEERAAAKLFSPEVNAEALDAAGGIQATRKFLAGPTPTQWLASEEARPAVDYLAGESSPSRILRAFGGKIPAVAVNGDPLAMRLAAQSDPEEIKNILRPYLGSEIAGPIKAPGGLTYGLKQGLANSILFGDMPERMIDPQDKNAAFTTIDGWLQTAHVPVAARDTLLDRFLTSTSKDETWHALTAVADATKQAMLAHGMPEERANELSRIFPNAANSARLYDFDQATKAERVRAGVVIDNAGTVLPEPQLTTEALNSRIELPDMAALRRATSKFAPLVTHPAWTNSQTALDAFTSFWRGAHLLRPGLGLRIVGDSQASLAANGYDSIFNHPLRVVSAMVGGNLDKRWAQNLAKLPGVNPSMAFDALDAPMISAYQDVEDAIHGGFNAYADPRKVALTDFLPVSRDHHQYAEALTEELSRMRGDVRLRGVAAQESPQAAKDWFWDGEGAAVREKSISLADDINEANRVKAGRLPGATMIPLDLRTREGSDQFVTDLLSRIEDTTGGHAGLRDAVVSGSLDGTPLMRTQRGIGSAANDEAIAKVRELADQGIGPDAVKARRTIMLTRDERQLDRKRLNDTFRNLFSRMVTEPDANLDRIPAYQQAYWGASDKLGKIERVLPYLDDTPVTVNGAETTARQLLIDRAARLNLPDEVMARIRNAPVDTSGARRLSLQEANFLAKSSALDEVPKVVHDLSGRSQFFDMTRTLFPFGDAFRRIATRWANTAWDHPNVLRRAEQGIEGARQSGFFHPDPVTGAEMFTYPGSQFLTDKLIGVPVPLTGSVSGLNLVGNGLPGVGPAVTIPAAHFLPDTPGTWEKINHVIFPLGRPASTGNAAGDIATSLEPAWANKLEQAVFSGKTDQRAFNDTAGAMMRYLASTGKYDLSGNNAASETDRLVSDAKDKARLFYVVRGLAQSVAPSAPTPEWQVEDKTGHLAVMAKVVDDYRKQESKQGADGALNWLLHTYGPDNMFIAQPFSQPIAYGVPVTKQGNDWADAHPGVRSAFPNTYGFFAPQGGKFDITAFTDQFTRGERKALSPEEMAAQANNRIGMWLYHRAQDQITAQNQGISVTSAQQDWLSQYRSALEQHYPGFNLVPFDDKRLPRAIAELTKAANDPSVAGTDAAAGLQAYLHYRDQAIAASAGYGAKTPFKAKATVPLRDWLRGAAKAIIAKHPDFAPMWNQIFSHELAVDVQGTAS